MLGLSGSWAEAVLPLRTEGWGCPEACILGDFKSSQVGREDAHIRVARIRETASVSGLVAFLFSCLYCTQAPTLQTGSRVLSLAANLGTCPHRHPQKHVLLISGVRLNESKLIETLSDTLYPSARLQPCIYHEFMTAGIPRSCSYPQNKYFYGLFYSK